jgi:hypothetical protein
MRLMMDVERPDALWLPLMTVQMVLRPNPSALVCSSSVRHPAVMRAPEFPDFALSLLGLKENRPAVAGWHQKSNMK